MPGQLFSCQTPLPIHDTAAAHSLVDSSGDRRLAGRGVDRQAALAVGGSEMFDRLDAFWPDAASALVVCDALRPSLELGIRLARDRAADCRSRRV